MSSPAPKTVLLSLCLLTLFGVCGEDSLNGPSQQIDLDVGFQDAGSDPLIEADSVGTLDIIVDEQSGELDLMEEPDLVADVQVVETDSIDESDGDWDSSDGEAGLPPYPRPTQEGWVHDIDDSFWANMDDLVFDVLQDHQVQIYLAIFSANFFNKTAYRALGMEIIRHPESYFANAVIPLLERYGDSGVIWAIDCMNEPEALVQDPTGNRAEWGVSWDEMRDFLSYCADIVHLHSSLPVSSGSGWHDWSNIELGYFSDLGFDFLDFHTYADSPAIPTVEELNVDSPVIIGECGQSSLLWNDELQLDAVRQCFSQAETGGYSAALSWYYNHAGSLNRHTHLNEDGSWRPVSQAFEEHTESELWVGTNLAWFSGAYDHDMAVNPFHPTWTVTYDHDTAVEVIEDLETHHIDLLRFWVFEGGEGVYFHQLFEDFENSSGRWSTVGDGLSLRSSILHVADGEASVAIHFNPSTTGWHGIAAQWNLTTPLNLATASEWGYTVHNDLDEAVGVNLMFVTDFDSQTITYQTYQTGEDPFCGGETMGLV